jgi:hypothetical protein
VFGLLVGRVLMLLDTGELKGEPRALVVVARLSLRVLVTVALVAGGASLIAGRFGGPYRLLPLTSAPCSAVSSTPGSSFSRQVLIGRGDAASDHIGGSRSSASISKRRTSTRRLPGMAFSSMYSDRRWRSSFARARAEPSPAWMRLRSSRTLEILSEA